MNDVFDVALRLAVVRRLPGRPAPRGADGTQGDGPHAGPAGPSVAGGFHGWAQLVADGVKFAQKEDVVPAAADRRVFQLAPAVALLPYLLVLAVIPVGPGDGAVGQVVDAGIFFVLAVMGIGVLGSLMARLGLRQQVLPPRRPPHRRAAPLLRAADAPGRRLRGHGRRHGLAHRHPRRLPVGGGCPGRSSAPWLSRGRLAGKIIGALVFFTAGLAELQRPPFDMPVADSEIIFGAYTEYTGLRFALFLLAEYAGIVVLCALTAVLFLGGWHGPFGADGLGWLWTLLKTAVLAFVVIWLRVSYPRLREDQLQKLAWTTLVPLALAQIALTGIVKVAIN
ncbi:NADH-quinone oxidoreductase subunit H [Streptomyces californicus]